MVDELSLREPRLRNFFETSCLRVLHRVIQANAGWFNLVIGPQHEAWLWGLKKNADRPERKG